MPFAVRPIPTTNAPNAIPLRTSAGVAVNFSPDNIQMEEMRPSAPTEPVAYKMPRAPAFQEMRATGAGSPRSLARSVRRVSDQLSA